MESEGSRIRTDNTVVELVGTLDWETVPEARKRIRKMALGSMSRCFEIDLAQVSSLDTAGVALLVEILKDLSGSGRELRLRNLNQPVKEIIQLAGLDPFFVVGKPEDEK
ncbi:MAG: STAS domain-containing protein [Syntrophobacteraceae bacterium]|nr:STAS domain-containing protein [Desulfobacteraceae bacterium]